MTNLAQELVRYGANRAGSRVRTADYYAMGGGLNLADPNFQASPGEVVGANNYEPGLRGGYRRCDGLERLDGRLRPHLSTYHAAGGTYQTPATPAVQGDTLTGATSGATGIFVQYNSDNTEICLTNITGTFQGGETLTNPSLQNEFILSEVPAISGASNDDLHRVFKYATQDYYRTLIQAVPGTGPVRGVWVHRDGIYAFRDNVAETESVMHEATNAGWSPIALGVKIRYWRGEKDIEEGDVLTGATSGATATVKRVAVFRGTTGAKDALGFVITDVVTGTYSAGEELQVNGTRVADLYPDAKQEIQVFFSSKASYHAVNIVDATTGSFNEEIEPALFEKITFHDQSTGTKTSEGYYLGVNKNPALYKPDQIGIVEWDGGTLGHQDEIRNANGDTFAFVSGAGDPVENGSDIPFIDGVWGDAAQQFYVDENVDFTAAEKIEAGNTLTGADSGASLTVKKVVVSSGSFEDKTAIGYVWADSVTTGPFTDGELLKVGTDVVGHVEEENGQINQLRFYNGEKRPEEGDTVTGATSAQTLTVKDVVVLRGSFKGGDAQGYITATGSSGSFTQNEVLQVGSDTVAQVTPTDTTVISVTDQKLLPGGRYEFRNMNFGGHTDTRRMYGVNGQQPAFEYDADDGVFVLIESGMSDDKPKHIGIHNNHLFLSFAGGSLQHSGYLRPYSFHPVTGADERTTGEEIVGIQEENQAIFIFTRNQTFVLYGEVRENFQMRLFSKNTGALEWTIQRIGTSYYVDDRGVTNLQATETFGNFANVSISQKIEDFVRAQIINNSIAGSSMSRRKNLYRLFFADGSGLVMGIGREGVSGFMPFDLGGRVAFCACSEEFESGGIFEERALVGAEDGFVYELDKGDNYDGELIEAFLRTSPHYSNSPSRYKRYRKCQLDIFSEGKTVLSVSPEYNFGLVFGGQPKNISVLGGGGFWNIDNWNEFKWSSPGKSYSSFKMEGSGYNVSFMFSSRQKDEPPHTIEGIMLQWSPRRIDRGTSN